MNWKWIDKRNSQGGGDEFVVLFFFFFLKIETVQNRDNNKGRETETGRFLRANWSERFSERKSWKGSLEGCRIILYAGRRGRPRSAPLDSPAWSRCWRRCLPRAPGRGTKWTGRRTVGAVLPTEVRRPGGADRRPGLRVLVFPARIRASVVERPLKVIKIVHFFFFLFLFSEMRLRDLFVMEILLDGTSVFSFISFEKIERRWRLAWKIGE